MINTRFWEDTYTSNLDPIEKLLFLYFLTNSSTSICGIYEIQLKKVAVETGVDREMVDKVLRRFSAENRIYYVDGWVGIKNFIKHQNQNSSKVKKGIESELESAPQAIKDAVSGKGIDTLSHPNPNPNSNLTQSNTRAPRTKKPPKYHPLSGEVLKAFEVVDPKIKTMYANITQRKSASYLIEEYGLDRVLRAIDILPSINQQNLYVAQITTPYELQQNWVKLGNILKKKDNDKKEKLTKTIW